MYFFNLSRDSYCALLSVDRLLGYLKRKTKSEASKIRYLEDPYAFCKYVGKQPDDLIRLSKEELEKLLHDYQDALESKGLSIKTINTRIGVLLTFFRVNGFKKEKELEVEMFHLPSRYRKRPQYIPTPEEVYRMSEATSNLRDRAIILVSFTSGLRNSTLRALTYGDIREELEKCISPLKIPVYPEMKQRVPDACKGLVFVVCLLAFPFLSIRL